MARKRQEWGYEEWDESTEAEKEKPQDPFGIPDAAVNDDWDLPEPPGQPKGKINKQSPGRGDGHLPKWLIPAIVGGCTFLLLILIVLPMIPGGPGTPSGSSGTHDEQIIRDPWTTVPAVRITEAPTQTPKPERTPTWTPVPPTASQTPSPTPTPKLKPTSTPKAISLLDQNEWYDKRLRTRYNHLTEHEKEIYEQLYDGLMHFSSSIATSHFTTSEMEHVTDALHFDTPELFQWEGGYRYTFASIFPEYRMSQSEYQTICEHIHNIIRRLRQEIPSGAGEYEKELIINTYLVDHCTYLSAENTSSAYADACLYKGRSQCSGYSRALILLLRAFGIECLAQKSTTHEWDLVRINGRWYHVDATWNDLENEDNRKGNRYYCWMNVPDRLVTDESHIRVEDDGFPYPACTSLEDNYAVREGLYITRGTKNPAKAMYDRAEKARRAGKDSLVVLVDDPSIVRNWDSVWNSFYYDYNGYDWLIYPPKDTQTVFMVLK